ncbi:MAG: hypothetical protein PVJ73_05150 [Acidobacteriota bacterium]|jgi:hypothetical protein
MASKLRTVSWVLLAVLGVLVLLVSGLSAQLAYWGMYPVGGESIDVIASGRDNVLVGLRGVRGTSAAWAAAWAVLFLAVVIGPYRRGDVTSWWGILASAIVMGVVVAVRVPVLGTQAGAGTALVILLFVILALLVDVKRLVQPAPKP